MRHPGISRNKKKREKGSSAGKIQFTSRVEKEYLKPSYSASIGEELEDGLFDGNTFSIYIGVMQLEAFFLVFQSNRNIIIIC